MLNHIENIGVAKYTEINRYTNKTTYTKVYELSLSWLVLFRLAQLTKIDEMILFKG